jgi:hypothetical protein
MLILLTGSLEGAERASVKKGGGSLILFCLLSLFLFLSVPRVVLHLLTCTL